MEQIHLAGPWITDHEINVVHDFMRSGWDNYKYVEKFETEFAAFHNREFALMTPCCTHAIHLLLIALDIKNGDEIIVPECTWTATAAPITYQKAIPVFADICVDDWCIDPKSVEKNITQKTKAVIAVDLFGNMPRMDELIKLCSHRAIPFIEDAAEALGSKYKGIRAGKFGMGSVFSFHRTKTITTGEGGILLLDDNKLYERAKFLRDHGRSNDIPYYTLEATPKYMPSNMQAAIGCAQFDRIEELINKKRKIFHMYKERLSNVDDIQLNIDSNEIYNGVWATSLIFGKSHNMKKIDAINQLSKLEVPARPFFYPLSSLPAYKEYNTGSKDKNPNSYDISQRGITLPCAYDLTEEQISKICDGIRKILGY